TLLLPRLFCGFQYADDIPRLFGFNNQLVISIQYIHYVLVKILTTSYFADDGFPYVLLVFYDIQCAVSVFRLFSPIWIVMGKSSLTQKCFLGIHTILDK